MALLLERLLAFMPGSFLVALSQIEIEDENEDRLLLNADGWSIAFEKASRVVSYSGRPAATFSSVESVVVEHFTNGKHFEWYVLSLRLHGGRKLTIGRSTDGSQVSMVAAHAATITGKKVRAFEKAGF